MSIPTHGRIVPPINKDTEFFWNGTREHRLLVQRCDGCGVVRHPPGPACPDCHSFDWTAEEVSGRGTLYSYAVLHHPRAPGFDGPVVTVIVELDDARIRLVSNIDSEGEPLEIGEPLELYFVDQDEGWTAPAFRRPTV
jgi:hypothetical protein